MIVLNCPACSSALMYYYGKTFEIDEREMEKIQVNLQMTTVQGILKNISTSELGHPLASVQTDHKRPTHKAGSPVRDQPLGPDDITNLKIELALARDISEFIKSI